MSTVTARWERAARWPFWGACLVLAAGVVFRLYRLDVFPGLDPDEVEGALAWFRDEPVLWYVYPSGRPHLNPLAPFVLWPFAALADPSAWVVRMPAVLAGLALLPATFVLVRRAFSATAALPATLLVAAAPFLIAYSRQGWDLAYVPVFTAIALGLAYQRRLRTTMAALTGLALIHPTAAFVGILAAAPFVVDLWRRATQTASPGVWRAGLAAACLLLYAAVTLALSAFTSEVPLRPGHVSGLVRLAVDRLAAPGLVDLFAGASWHALTGPQIYAEFLGSAVPGGRVWPAAALAALWALGVFVFRRDRRHNALVLLVALPAALLAQYVAIGQPDLLVPWKVRYFLWSAVPACWLLACVIDAAFSRWSPRQAALPVAVVISSLWLASFYGSYLRPLATGGGQSASLDYRAATVQPRAQVLDIVRSQRTGDAPATLFAGEGRLHLGLLYLASGDASVHVRNLGRPYYQTQQDDAGHLQALYDMDAGDRFDVVDVFFVDYTWGEVPGTLREIHAEAARPAAGVVAPWQLEEVGRVTTSGGAPLLTVWRLVRPEAR